MSDLFHSLKDAVADRYQLEIELGSGGMATVYRAVDRLHKRRVALKILHPRLAGAVGHDRFLQEIRFAAELTHPHILPLLDSGTVTIDDRVLPYYVMPFVEGESLRARLQRQKQLPIEEALAIARDVAAALSYAHAHKVVHRDIKPENILLAGNEAVVADFGIARAINRAAESEVITTEGMAVGTPAYMSPEQSLAAQEIDGRTDIYSLGCVMYEMLGGSPPFTGGTPQAVVARHQMDPVPSLTTIRPTVPIAFELIIKKSLQKQPADRFQSSDELVRALGATASGAIPTIETRSRSRRRFWTALMLLGVAASGTVAAILIGGTGNGGGGGILDTTLFAVIPTQQEGGPSDVDPSLLLQDALAGWRGVNLVDPFQVRAAITRDEGSGNWAKVARQLKAGRYVRVDATRISGSIRINAVLYDTKGDEQLANYVERVAPDYSNADSIFALLAERLLFRDDSPRTQLNPVVGTMIMPARQAFQRGYRALEDWNLPAADSAFDAATRHDPQFAQAFLWLAMVRRWNSDPPAQWRSAIERATSGRERLSIRDRDIAAALMAQSQGQTERSCGMWRRLSDTDRASFIAWYGWGDCLLRDDIVIRAPSSPTGYRFRSSYHRGLEAYRKAFELLPSIHSRFRAGAFDSVRTILRTSTSHLRAGRALAPDTTSFLAAASWSGDTLVFFPIPSERLAGGASARTSTSDLAVRKQRQLFHEIALSWVTALPRSSDAMQALAVSLELLGNPAALDTMARARTLAATPAERLRVAVAEVWMRMKFSIPNDPAGLRVARRLADSILSRQPSTQPEEPEQLAGIATLLGRADEGARYAASPGGSGWTVPAALARDGIRFLVYASLGGPLDTLLAIESRLTLAIDRSVELPQRRGIRLMWLAYPATLALPNTALQTISGLAGSGDVLIDLQAAYLRGDSSGVRTRLAQRWDEIQMVPPADLTLDALYPEAWLVDRMGDPQAAARWLDPTLNVLVHSPPDFFSEPARAGSLVRAMAFRAEIADRLGDRATARRWASIVAILWSDPDEFLVPVLRRMTVLAN